MMFEDYFYTLKKPTNFSNFFLVKVLTVITIKPTEVALNFSISSNWVQK